MQWDNKKLTHLTCLCHSAL